MQFLFGKPVLPVKPSADSARKLFFLGAYPSALHIRWFVPGFTRPIMALAVDNEPQPFWDGKDEKTRILNWQEEVNFREKWGRIEPCGNLNGSSGTWLGKNVLTVLRVDNSESWITDCLNTYHESKNAAERLDSSSIVNAINALGIPKQVHQPHPSENEIVKLALQNHKDRLVAELFTANPTIVVTLGNAALRVFQKISESTELLSRKLSPDNSYGDEININVGGKTMVWIPLAHPAAPPDYQSAHLRWVEKRENCI
jgi:hypothetical protein